MSKLPCVYNMYIPCYNKEGYPINGLINIEYCCEQHYESGIDDFTLKRYINIDLVQKIKNKRIKILQKSTRLTEIQYIELRHKRIINFFNILLY